MMDITTGFTSLKAPNPAAIALAASILVATTLIIAAHTPPNPPPRAPTERDHVGKLLVAPVIQAYCFTTFALGAYHAILALTFPSPPPYVCPSPTNLSPQLFTWNCYTAACIVSILALVPMRLLCFRQLGPSFTFRLGTPKKLVTTGLYAYVQHPSYTSSIVVICSAAALFLRIDGVAGCWFPEALVAERGVWGLLRIVPWVMTVLLVYVTRLRVRDEESMLKKAFGREWEVYHERTRRFVPFLF